MISNRVIGSVSYVRVSRPRHNCLLGLHLRPRAARRLPLLAQAQRCETIMATADARRGSATLVVGTALTSTAVCMGCALVHDEADAQIPMGAKHFERDAVTNTRAHDKVGAGISKCDIAQRNRSHRGRDDRVVQAHLRVVGTEFQPEH